MDQIIAVDLDGTLLSSENQITEYTKKIITLLFKKKTFYPCFRSTLYRYFTD